MVTLRNNISEDLKTWRDEHSMDLKDFSPAVIASRSYKLQRLKDLNAIYYKYYAQKDFRGTAALNNLRAEKQVLEKTIYKRPLSRLIHFIAEAIRAKSLIKEINKKVDDETNQVRSVTNKIGRHGTEGIEEQVRLGAKCLSTGSSTHQMSDYVVMDYQMDLYKGEKGYSQSAYKVRISSGNDRKTVKTHTIKLPINNLFLNPKQVYNLVSGRAVQLDDSRWLRLDMTDRDAEGNLNKAKVFNIDGFMVEVAASKTILKEMPVEDFKILVDKIKNGNEETVEIKHQGKMSKFNVKADPGTGQVSVVKIDPDNGQRQISNKRLLKIPLNAEAQQRNMEKRNAKQKM